MSNTLSSIHAFSKCRRLDYSAWEQIKETMFHSMKLHNEQIKSKNNQTLTPYKVYQDKNRFGSGYHYVDERYQNDGMQIILHQYPLKITSEGFVVSNYNLEIIVNPRRLLGDSTYIGIFDLTDSSIQQLNEEINKRLRYLGNIIKEPNHDLWTPLTAMDFHYKRIDLCSNLYLPNVEMANDIMSLLQRCRVPERFKRYRPYSNLSKRNIMCKDSVLVYCSSVAIEAYHKKNQMKKQMLKYPENDILQAQNLIRVEVHLCAGRIQMLQKQCQLNCPERLDFLYILKGICQKQLLAYIDKLFLTGYYHTFEYTVSAIQSSNYQMKTKQLLLKILEMTNSPFGSLEKALFIMKDKEKMSSHKVLQLIKKFNELGVNPVTFPKKISGHVCLPCLSRLLSVNTLL